MKKYLIKIRVYPPRKINHGLVEQFLPDYDNPNYVTLSREGDFEDCYRFARNMKMYHNQFIGTRAEVVSVAEA